MSSCTKIRISSFILSSTDCSIILLELIFFSNAVFSIFYKKSVDFLFGYQKLMDFYGCKRRKKSKRNQK